MFMMLVERGAFLAFPLLSALFFGPSVVNPQGDNAPLDAF
jgi:hypothetical protein